MVQMNLLTKQNRVTDVENKLMLQGRKLRGGINWEMGTDIHTTLYIKQITNKDIPRNTGNTTQYSIMVYRGKESKKRVDTCVCTTDSVCCTRETNTLWINHTPIKINKNPQMLPLEVKKLLLNKSVFKFLKTL